MDAEFGDDINFVFRHFPVITAQSPKAAEAAQCAGDQGQFWEYHDFIYERGTGLSSGLLKSYASSLGLNTAEFDSCLDSGEFASYVRADQRLAVEAGARGTPTFMVNGQIIAAPTFATLVNAINAAK